jgi:MFS transporter, DHA1 family, multidrug resistance protein
LNHRLVVPAAMLFSTFAWSFVFVSLPFHVRELSTLDAAGTLRWTGWILGITNLVTVVTAPVWGRLGARFDPKALYVAVELLQGVTFFGMAAARTLGELFVVRFVLGGWGAASTFAFMIAGRAPSAADVRREVSFIQSALTVGQVMGPLIGAVTAARLGFRMSFVVGGVILLGCTALVYRGVSLPPAPRMTADRGGPTNWRDVASVATIVLAGSMQLQFLPAILPEILPTLGVDETRLLEVGGFVIFVSGVAAALGSLVASRLADAIPEARLIPVLLLLSSLVLVAFGLANSVWLLGALRFLQVLCIAPVFPIVVARIAHRAHGDAIGFINSARIAAAFLGPVMATSLLAWTPAPVLYACLGAVGAACVPVGWRMRA